MARFRSEAPRADSRAAACTAARAATCGAAVAAAVAAAFAFAAPLAAQPVSPSPSPSGAALDGPRRTIATNPLAIPFGVVSGEFERAVGTHGLAVGVGGLTTFGRDPEVINDGGSDAFRSLQLKLKYYPAERGLRGFAVGLTAGVAYERELRWASSQFDQFGREVFLERVTWSRTAPTVGATVDYNLFLGRRDRFLVGLGIGARRALTSDGNGPLGEPLFDPRLQFGFAF